MGHQWLRPLQKYKLQCGIALSLGDSFSQARNMCYTLSGSPAESINFTGGGASRGYFFMGGRKPF